MWPLCVLLASLALASASGAQTKTKPSSATAAAKPKAKNSAAKKASKSNPGASAAAEKSKKAKPSSAKSKPAASAAKASSTKPKGKNGLGTKASAEVDVIDAEEDEESSDEAAREESDADKDDDNEKDDKSDEHGANESRPSSASPKAPSLELGVQAGILRRDFDYAGRQGPGLRAFELPGAPTLGASLVLFPFASSSSALSMVGLEAGYSTIVGVTSDFGGTSFDTSASAYRIQLVLNLPVGKEVSFRPKLGYSGRTLVVSGDTLPNLSEHGPRLGLEGRLATSSFLAELEGGLQYLVSGGELTSSAWFPSASGFGADLRARGGLSLADPFQVLVEGALDYSSFKLNVGANDPHPNGVAESASDVALSLSLVARLVLR